METILEQIVHRKRRRLFGGTYSPVQVADLIARAKDRRKEFLRALAGRPGPNVIAEIKAASPSRGTIMPSLSLPVVARTIEGYERCGASAISVVTEEEFFGGSPVLLSQVLQSTDLPVLRKDFVIEETQIFETAFLGASALLLIARIVSWKRLEHFIDLCELVGIAPLVEVHDRRDLDKALEAGAFLVGINNRNLATLQVSIEHTLALLPAIPPGISVVSESGFRQPTDIRRVMAAGVVNFLIGETLLLSEEPGKTLKELKEVSLCPS
ncbi:MAG TPA: indole-3-glycerol phosphate synthase TrpC [Atribacteraceae bacterium]|nr:indole-3-glycerol phosphate synthase TrpC [Atribacteraceae bacterium]